jgi:mono/diheme cytochrome c family protein
MKPRTVIVGALSLGVAGVAAFFLLTVPSTIPASAITSRTASITNGQTVYNASGCANCHATPGQDDRLKLGGGLGIGSPFGVFKVPNISSDPNVGIGAWTEVQFINAIMRGVGRNDEHLFPALPYTSYQRMTLDDARDLYAYMQTLPADARPSEPHAVPFPFNVRRNLGLWKLLFLDKQPFVPDPQKDAATNRGAYLVDGLGHCAECHSGRNALGGIKAAERFAGGALPDGKGWVPNITPHPDGLATWSVRDLEFFLLNGLTPDGASVAGEMAAVVRSTAQLTAADRTAMALYLKSLPARAGKKPTAK